jgi:glutaminyl-peptide cyclotransferase
VLTVTFSLRAKPHRHYKSHPYF